MTNAPQSMAILFADISGSTPMFERLGTEAAARVVATALNTMTALAEARGGTLRRVVGDEILCTFPDADAALLAALDMQPAMGSDPILDEHGVSVRIGMHAGPVLIEAGELYGDAVNVAARMGSLARAGQIVTTRDMATRFPPAWAPYFRTLPPVKVKGKRGTTEVVEVIWETDGGDLTLVATRAKLVPIEPPELELTHGGTRTRIGPRDVPYSIGRAPTADLVVDHESVSRRHATVDLLDRVFVLTDKSTNGTVVALADGQHLAVHRSHVHLPRSGSLILGKRGQASPTVEFARVDPALGDDPL